jgi:hypothetical protein
MFHDFLKLTIAQRLVCGCVALEQFILAIALVYGAIISYQQRHDLTVLTNGIVFVSGMASNYGLFKHIILTQNLFMLLVMLWSLLVITLLFTASLVLAAVTAPMNSALIVYVVCFSVADVLLLTSAVLATWKVRAEFKWKVYTVLGADIAQQRMCDDYYVMEACCNAVLLIGQTVPLTVMWSMYGTVPYNWVFTLLTSVLALCMVVVYRLVHSGVRRNRPWMLKVAIFLNLVCVVLCAVMLSPVVQIRDVQNLIIAVLVFVLTLGALGYTVRTYFNLKKGLDKIIEAHETMHHQEREHKMELE